MIKKIYVKNFRSFNELEIDLRNFNVLIGPNASGKSNFVEIFKFLRDILKFEDLENPISLQNGIEYFRNLKAGKEEISTFRFYLEFPVGKFSIPLSEIMSVVFPKRKGTEKVKSLLYEFSIKCLNNFKSLKIINEKMKIEFFYTKFSLRRKKSLEKDKKEKGEVIVERKNGSIFTEIKYKNEIREIEFTEQIPENSLFVQILSFFSPMFKDLINGISIYDFDPRLLKGARPIGGELELKEDGSNLPIVLKNVLNTAERRNRFINFIKYLLPFVEKIDVEKSIDNSLLLKLKEIYHNRKFIYSPLISDGTINITALLLALFFEKKEITIIEEPERNIHPYLISKIIELMKEASKNKQIIITTHNPEVVKYADLENILLITRNESGFSVIKRPVESKEVKTFLKHQIGVDELFVKDLLNI